MADLDFCEYATGLPPVFYDLLVAVETTGAWTQFYVDNTVEVDWGSGHYLTYGEGIVYGRQTNPYSSKPVIIRSPEEFEVKTLRFGSGANWDNTYLSINILKAADLVNATKLCYRLESMHTFTFFGNNQIASFESAWEDCTELLLFEGMDTTRALTFKKAWKNANKLITFPNIYARECLTVEEAWMGCTAMVEFPVIDVSNCKVFKNAWRGNVQLSYFPYIDTGAGEDFDHAWAYTTKLSYFPALDFTSALNMDYAFAYMKRILTMPFIDSKLATTFNSTFRKMLRLECIAGVDTNSISSRNDTTNMFYLADALVAPTSTQQEQIRDGYRYINTEPCYYDAGRSTFFMHCETNGEETSFKVTGGDFEIDWGDGLFLPYNEGTVCDIPIFTNGVNIRSEENITKIEFVGDTGLICDTLKSVEIKRGRTLTSVAGLCKGLTNLEYFEILGNVDTTDYSEILHGCINLLDIGELDLSLVTTLSGAFYNCEKLIEIEENQPIDMSSCTNFYETFYGCKAFVHMQKLLTPVGEDFTRMLADMTLLECLDAVDTRNQTTTFGMFDNDPELLRPSINEVANILTGYNYDNLGNCGGGFSLIFTGNDTEVQIVMNGKVIVDWGDGNFIEYASGVTVTGTPLTGKTVYLLGEASISEIAFLTTAIVDIEFVHAERLTTLNGMYKDDPVIHSVVFSSDNIITDCTSAFENSSIVNFEISQLDYCTLYTDMFKDTSSLQTVNNMKTMVGEQFEGMFENSSISCIGEIYTCYGQFPAHYVMCAAPPLSCVPATVWQCDEQITDIVCPTASSMLDCSGYLDVCIYWDCDMELDIFEDSTMFLNANNLSSPDSEQQNKIINRFHYIGVEPC